MKWINSKHQLAVWVFINFYVQPSTITVSSYATG